MQNNYETIGIIDIGSNSIRLAIYETTPRGEYRLIHELKESARLSEKMNAQGAMETKEIQSIVPILRQFREVCRAYRCRGIRVAATAAIRNAANAQEIGRMLEEQTGLTVEILSGEQEAYFGFIAVAGGMAIEDGFIIDIGGGSTEITLFRGRQLIDSVSLPIGAVNAQVKFGVPEEPWPPEQVARLQEEVGRMLDGLPWIGAHPGLPLIGLGGTIRTLGKLDQRRRKYPLRLAHHYRLEPESLRHYAEALPRLTLEKRKRIDGLSKARADIIVPGTILLKTVFDRIGAVNLRVSGSGLREGLLQDTLGLEVPAADQVLEQQASTLLAFHGLAPTAHYRKVRQYAEQLYGVLTGEQANRDHAKLLGTAAMLYKIGGTIRYHQYDKHTLYWLLHAPLGAFTHREAVLCSYIADYPANHGKKSGMEEFRTLLQEKDDEDMQKLGALLEVAVALDASETQTVAAAEAVLEGEALLLKLKCRSQAYLETRQLEAAAKSFKKAWDLRLEWEIHPSSTR
ncbi:Ppx/GppA phosphatase family protein [Paenibacillus phocaensis]|uniref:Ppx/GppA phosphatase family protein n=1 Tax=Paenibacillus phocaensis TaxID=1776378 RepID=UPI00039B3A64|nr:Ppx/GppA phosphatase family protein [Paenibacillus phocaensis]